MPPGGLIYATQVERFRADLTALVGHPSPFIGLAVSGGGDSLALLLLASAAFPGGVTVASVDHGLRAEAASETAGVATLCRTLGVPHATLTARLRTDGRSNVQDRARAVRYRLLADWARRAGVDHVATAHHRDDVAESFLMRAARGGGVRSLAAMPTLRALAGSPVLLVRPLLGWSRAELSAIVDAAALEPVVDPSNLDGRFDRARVRRLLATTPELPSEGLARAATNLRDVEEALEWLMPREVAARWEEDDREVRLRLDDVPFELRRRLAARAIEAVRRRSGRLGPWRETALPALIRTLQTGGSGVVADVRVVAQNDRWCFTEAPPRRTG